MFKKLVLIAGLSLSFFSIAHADMLSAPEKDFNEQVMNIMKDIENKAIDQKNIDEYLSHLNVANKVKQAVKSNVELHIKYSDFHKLTNGIYLCNKANRVGDEKNSKCMCFGSYAGGCSCTYYYGSTCSSQGYGQCK